MITTHSMKDVAGDVSRFLLSYRHVPCAEFGVPLDTKLTDYVVSALGDSDVLLYRSQQEIQGVLVLRKLDWDSHIFHLPMGRIEIFSFPEDCPEVGEQLMETFESAASAEGFKHVSTRLNMAEMPSLHLLEKHGFFTVDSLQTLVCKAEGGGPTPHCRPYRKGDIDSVLAIARKAFERNRFVVDPHLNKDSAANVYAEWVKQDCDMGRAQHSAVLEVRGEVAGFVLCCSNGKIRDYTGIRLGAIDLIALDDKYKGQGFGTELIHDAKNWLRENCDIYTVGTRCDNFAALRSYLKAGFRICSSKLGLHKWF